MIIVNDDIDVIADFEDIEDTQLLEYPILPLPRHKNRVCNGSPAFPLSGPVVSRQERLNFNSRVASVKQNRHHHHKKICNALSHHCTVAWVTRPERPKDVIKQA